VLVLCIVARARVLGDAVEEATPNEGVSIPGRVVDLENGNPVKGASVVVERLLPGLPASILPAWAGATTLTTDSDGRFVVSIPPEQVAERRLAISLQVAHPDFIPRKSSTAVPMVEILLGRKGGDPAFFETIKLVKGVEYSGQVVTPEADPAAGTPFELVHWGDEGNPSDHFVDETQGKTDAEGRFRLRSHKTHQLAIYITPAAHAPFQQFWGTNEPGKQPDLWVPSDLGRLVLAQGIRLSGRLLNLMGRPIAGQSITVKSIYSRHERSARTNADGRFTFAALRPGNYALLGQAQTFGGGYDSNALTVPPQGVVFKPAKVYLKDGIVPDQVVIREAPTVTIEARFVDSKDRPARGSFVVLAGQIPAINNQPAQQEPIFEDEGLASSINGTEREDKSTQFTNWQTHTVPDAAGRLLLRVPKELENAQIFAMPINETISIRNRIGDGKPLTFGFLGSGSLGDLKSDIRGASFVLYDAPKIMATVKTEDGESPAVNIQVSAGFRSEGNEYGAGFVEQADGRYRSQNLLPDQEYEVSAWATGFVPNRVERLRLREGASINLNLIIKRQPKPPTIGDFAPPFLVKTLDGEPLSLGELRGKFVLLHFWNPLDDNCLQELVRFKAVRDRFGKDDRLAMIGFCPVASPNDVAKVIKEKGLSWPQVILRDRVADSVLLEYDAGEVPKTFLIGPDGKLVATELAGEGVVEAIAKALGRK
jgi:peroxiredoxin